MLIDSFTWLRLCFPQGWLSAGTWVNAAGWRVELKVAEKGRRWPWECWCSPWVYKTDFVCQRCPDVSPSPSVGINITVSYHTWTSPCCSVSRWVAVPHRWSSTLPFLCAETWAVARLLLLGLLSPQPCCSLSFLALCSVHHHLQSCTCDMTARAIILPPWKAMLHGPQTMPYPWFVGCWLRQLS